MQHQRVTARSIFYFGRRLLLSPHSPPLRRTFQRTMSGTNTHATTTTTTKNEATTNTTFPVQAAVTAKLTQALNPSYLDVMNESHMHNVPKHSETHFKVVVVSSRFDQVKSPLQRHRLIHDALKEEMDNPIHALSIVAKSPKQWEDMMAAGKTVEPSPKCRGGDGSLPSK